ncbi:MAG: hypothetical protein D6694_13290 [Gammaproteobacteria bacterium]|nr:MAG: hypothetical protein D6694_13290 [Gammaproteobacteria bacterium]
MFRFILTMLFLFLTPLTFGEVTQCYKDVNIKIQRVRQPVRFTKVIKKRATITLRVKTDCKTGAVRIPSTFEEAVEFLDFALPLDYKDALVSESTQDELDIGAAYRKAHYGESVNDDLFDYFYNAWFLGEKNNICEKKFGDKYFGKGIGCYYLLLEHLVEAYKKGALESARASEAR